MSFDNPASREPLEENANSPTLSDEQERESQSESGQTEAVLSRRSRLSLTIGLFILAAAVALANWPYPYANVSRIAVGQVDSPVDFVAKTPESPIMGGWPFRYLIQYPSTIDGQFDRQSPIVRFSPLALVYDLAIGGLVSGCLFLYWFRRARQEKSGGGRISIADLLVLTLVLAAPLGWWQHVNARHAKQTELATAVQNAGGSYTFSAAVPQLFASVIPKPITEKLGRVREVRLEYPSHELMSQLVEQREIEILRVGGGDYDLSLIERLVANPHLVDLRIAGRVLDAKTMQAMVAHKRLHTLNLMRTNVSAESLQLLDQLPNLRRLNLIHTDVVLSDLGAPGWSQTVRELSLPHPEAGDTASVRIAGWPKLESLVINEFETQMNTTPMAVELADLPLLSRLQLDVFQKFDLTLRNLPKLAAIDEIDFQWRSRLPRGGTAPGHIWCGHLDIDGLPALEKLYFFCLGLKHFRARNVPKLEFAGIAAFYRTQSASAYAAELKPDAATALIIGLGESDGPRVIDLDAVPMKDVDLAPLAKNKGITTIMLSQSGSNIHQWMALEPMKWLKRLDVKDCPLDDAGFQWILDAFPELEHFACTPQPTSFYASANGGIEAIEIVNRPNLRTLDLGESATEYFSHVRIVDSPNLTVSLKLGDVDELEIANAQSIRGLSVASPIPAGAKLAGVRDLQFFAVGGPTVTDEFIAPLAACESLSVLTLAYPAVTADGLRNLKAAGVGSLNLPGAALDDSVVADWPEFSLVRNLDLRDTQVSGASVDRILAARAATRLILDHTKVKKSELGFLTELADLSELSLAGVGIDAATLGGLLAHQALTHLDLSDSEITTEILDKIASQAGPLQYLVLRDCEFDDSKLADIAAKHPGLRFDLSGSNVSTELMASLLSAERIVGRDEWQQQITIQKMVNLASKGSFQEIELEFPAMIDVRRFAPLSRQPSVPASVPGVPAGVPSVPGGGIMFEPTPIDAAPSAPIGKRFGQWLGSLLGRQSTAATPETEDEVENEAFARETSKEQSGE